MDIRMTDVRNFLEIVHAESLSEAARRLDITQPSISESLKRLEKDVAYKLFYRTKKGVSLTPQGKTFYIKAKVLWHNYSELSNSSIEDDQKYNFTIIISCHPVVASYTLPSVISEMHENKNINVKFIIKHASSEEAQKLVQSGSSDLGIVINPIPVPDMVIKALGKDRVYVWNSKNKYNKEKIILNSGMFQSQVIVRKWKGAPKDRIESDNLEFIARLVNTGAGYGILPEKVVSLLGLKLVKNKQLPFYDDVIALVHRPEFGKKYAEKVLLDHIKKQFL